MKLLLVLSLLLSLNAKAAILGAPFMPEEDNRFNTIENSMTKLNHDSSQDSGIAKKYARAVYDVAVNGGASVSHDLGVTIPAGAVVTSVLVYINTKFADAGTGSLKLECNGNGDLMDYRDITASNFNDVLFGGLTPTASTTGGAGPMIPQTINIEKTGYDSVATACSIKAVVKGTAGFVPLTAGKLTAIVEYFQK